MAPMEVISLFLVKTQTLPATSWLPTCPPASHPTGVLVVLATPVKNHLKWLDNHLTNLSLVTVKKSQNARDFHTPLGQIMRITVASTYSALDGSSVSHTSWKSYKVHGLPPPSLSLRLQRKGHSYYHFLCNNIALLHLLFPNCLIFMEATNATTETHGTYNEISATIQVPPFNKHFRPRHCENISAKTLMALKPRIFSPANLSPSTVFMLATIASSCDIITVNMLMNSLVLSCK